jgi:hypothetical protein
MPGYFTKTPSTKKTFVRSVLFVSFVLIIFMMAVCSPRQKVLLIGTHHTTPGARLSEVRPVAEAVKRFQAEIICAEYLIPTDTPSLLYRGGNNFFQDVEAKRKEGMWHEDTVKQ